MAELSKATQLLIPVAHCFQEHGGDPPTRIVVAAAIEALADQVVPATLHPADKEFWPGEEDERQWQYDRCKRAEILAIAAELRGTTTP